MALSNSCAPGGGKKILVAMSGGVDSSVALYLLQQQGYRCMGVTMRLYDNELLGESRSSTCCSLADVEDARQVATALGVPYYVFDFTADFEAAVIRRFAAAYAAGGTPNPCIDCNRYLIFDRLYRRARLLGCDGIATGHYARILRDADGGYHLHTALDPAKDQSYVLYDLSQEQLAHTLFPLGELTKAQVRKIAAEQGFYNAAKQDSQDICFVPDGDYAAFLTRYAGSAGAPGPIRDTGGRLLGRHAGLCRYTLGQRKGIGVAASAPLYVVAKDVSANTLIVGPEAALYTRAFAVQNLLWLAGAPPAAPQTLEICCRYHARRVPVTLTPGPGDTGTGLAETPLRAVTPGQSAVFYRGTEVVAGGVFAGAAGL